MIEPLGEPRIITDPQIAFGKPTIAGTRITVEQIIEELAAGLTIDNLMEQHDLSREAIQAAFRYIAALSAP